MKKKGPQINYRLDKQRIEQFLSNFEDPEIKPHPTYHKRKYIILMQAIANKETQRMDILFKDLQIYFKNQSQIRFLQMIASNTKHYQEIFNQVVFEKLPNRTTIPEGQEKLRIAHQTTLWEQRHINFNMSKEKNKERSKRQKFPLKLFLYFNVYIIKQGCEKQQLKSISQLSAKQLGCLVNLRTMVVRVNQVRPQMIVATYNCDLCGHQIYQQVDGRPDFLPLTQCVSKVCLQRKSHGKINLSTSTSKMIAFQEIKVQETSQQIEEGGVPKTFTIIAKRDNVRKCTPGDIIRVQGVLLPIQKASRNRQNFVYSSYLQVYKITKEKQKYNQLMKNIGTQFQVQTLRSKFSDKELYTRLAMSISPQTYGLIDVKKSLLLQMVGGPGVAKEDGMRIRGDINIALIGDPGVAKSQLLKRVTFLAPRGVYTTGKGSSGVGLTASIKRDPVTNQLSLQGGALVLADTGVCCIDEFDKMQENDRTAIHEVMQQQSVSIAKAGIVASLNARTSILAAANPFYGRYDKKRTVQQNVHLPAALMSRFDLIFLLLDSNQDDQMLSRKILNTHMKQQDLDCFSSATLRNFISRAKSVQPQISWSMQQQIAKEYVKMREQSSDRKQTRVTPRNLLGLLRLATARARLRFSPEVSLQDFQQAKRLFKQSKIQGLTSQRIETNQKNQILKNILKIITERCSRNAQRISTIEQIEKRVLAKGMLTKDLKECIEHFERMGSLQVMEGNIIKKI